MIMPLVVLAIASLLGGFLGLPGKLGVIQSFLEPVFAPANQVLGIEEHGLLAIDYVLMAVSLIVAMLGIALAWLFYMRRMDLPVRVGGEAAAALQGGLQQVLHRRVLRRDLRRAGRRWLALGVAALR